MRWEKWSPELMRFIKESSVLIGNKVRKNFSKCKNEWVRKFLHLERKTLDFCHFECDFARTSLPSISLFKVCVMNLYVGNLSYQMTDDDLHNAFSAYGEVSSAKIIMDRETGRSKGFGFVEMPNDDEGQEAIKGLDGTDVGGRSIKVNEARPRTDAPRGPRY